MRVGIRIFEYKPEDRLSDSIYRLRGGLQATAFPGCLRS
jgi:hypothetical protein